MLRKLLLVKEIVSKEGVLHFRRYRLLSTPWFTLYLHHICKSDEDLHMHDHPWDFESMILSGSYAEFSKYPPNFDKVTYNKYYAGDVIKHKAADVHKIMLLTPEVWTLVCVTGKKQPWGYQTAQGWMDHILYRALKNKGQLPD